MKIAEKKKEKMKKKIKIKNEWLNEAGKLRYVIN